MNGSVFDSPASPLRAEPGHRTGRDTGSTSSIRSHDVHHLVRSRLKHGLVAPARDPALAGRTLQADRSQRVPRLLVATADRDRVHRASRRADRRTASRSRCAGGPRSLRGTWCGCSRLRALRRAAARARRRRCRLARRSGRSAPDRSTSPFARRPSAREERDRRELVAERRASPRSARASASDCVRRDDPSRVGALLSSRAAATPPIGCPGRSCTCASCRPGSPCPARTCRYVMCSWRRVARCGSPRNACAPAC